MIRLHLTLILVGAMVCLGCADSVPVNSNAQATLTSLQKASRAWRHGDLQAARHAIKQELLVNPDNSAAAELAGDIERAANELPTAIAFYQEAVRASSPPTKQLLDKLGRSQMAAGHVFAAVESLELSVRWYPDDRALRVDLVGLLIALGREPESGPHLQWLISRGYGTLNLLSVVSDLTRSQVDEAICRHAIQSAPEDLRPEYALTRRRMVRREWKNAADVLEKVIARHPDFRIAHAYYLRAIVELNDQGKINAWRLAMPDSIELEPQYWKAVGIWAERHEQEEAAARAFLRACRLEPNDVEAHNQLAFALAKLNHPEEAAIVTKRAAELARVRQLVDAIQAAPQKSQSTMVALAQSLERLGRLWEAAAWLRGAAAITQQTYPTLPAVYAGIHRKLTAKTPWHLPDAAISKQLQSLPIDSWADIDLGDKAQRSVADSNASPPSLGDESLIRFADVAKSVGLNHLCKIREPQDPRFGVWIYQASAGGAAVIDYDLDGWPDIHLSVVDGEPLQENSGPNQFYRNLDGHFKDVTDSSHLGDRGFTQGLSIADVNADGFDDVFVANIGRNRLYVNCGDGTFIEVSEQWGLHGEHWTTSAALVDINLDGLIDLYEVNYCAGPEPYEQVCSHEGIVNPCIPTTFSAQSDSIWQGQPHGGFTDKTGQWISDTEPGRGFGIVAGLLDDQPGIDLYVANDMSANQFWSTGSKSDEPFSLQDQARLRGVAFDRRSSPQASMGIAAGDPDLDGDIDLYATHFTGEYNTYYEQVSPGIWSDVSERNGHAMATTPMLAFGTQFIDAENDGSPELLIANGHVFNTGGAEPYRMPNQLMHRSSDGNWTTLSPQTVGDVFSIERISRSLVTWDYNRDGRMDALVTHLFDPITLLENQSQSKLNSVTLSLKGTRSSVDAVGAMVDLSIGKKTIRAQLLGGCGFQSSNQRCLHVGLGNAKRVDRLTVHWPSGLSEEFGHLDELGEYLLVEGQGLPFQLSR